MKCCICDRDFADNETIVMVDVGIQGRPTVRRFTGVVWCVGCTPTNRPHIRDEADALMRRAPAPPTGDGQE